MQRDQRVTVGSAKNQAGAVLPGLRLVTAAVAPKPAAARRGAKPVVYEILTDRWDLDALEVVQVYLWRWTIEPSQPQCPRTDHRSGLDAALVALPSLSILPRRRSCRLLDVRCARRLTDPDPTGVVPVRPLVALA